MENIVLTQSRCAANSPEDTRTSYRASEARKETIDGQFHDQLRCEKSCGDCMENTPRCGNLFLEKCRYLNISTYTIYEVKRGSIYVKNTMLGEENTSLLWSHATNGRKSNFKKSCRVAILTMNKTNEDQVRMIERNEKVMVEEKS
ncbi:hypothetical protein WA026_023496 [Henosepilachna vigintioctopunctata]|uniref:Uncharacterized protein n=1 Tax=Henosepilachna vigintioctopunctata TaxID=420089 RepID=A0AAW1V5P4_9CUCU